MADKAIVLLSGGMDSAVTLALALRDGFDVIALSFDYQQRHNSEIHAAIQIVRHFDMTPEKHKILKLDLSYGAGSALINHEIQVPEYKSSTNDIPVTYVPARNSLFLCYALGVAESIDANSVYIGINAVDYSGYPDCRPEFLQAFSDMARLATKQGTQAQPIKFIAPLLHLRKEDIIRLGDELLVPFEMTVSCYTADSQGRACGKCDACVLRKKGFLKAHVTDTTCYL